MKVIVESGTGKILGEYLIGAEASSLTAVAAAQVSKPPVPEFTLKYVDTSYDVPQTSSIDPYTRNETIKAGYHVNKSLELTIKNQPAYDLFYNVRYKGHFEDNWTEVFSYQHSFPESPLRLKIGL